MTAYNSLPGCESLLEGFNQFAASLLISVSQKQRANVVFSPSSLVEALSMTMSGAMGDTAREIAQALNISQPGDHVHEAVRDLKRNTRTGGIDLRIANRLWGQRGYNFLLEFLANTQEYYGSKLEEVDFQSSTKQSRELINVWVEKQTEGKICDLIEPGRLSIGTRLVLTNAIYFQGTWEYKFNPNRTAEASFYVQPNESVAVPMMEQTRSFRYGEFADLQVLEMPFRSRTLTTHVLLDGDDSSSNMDDSQAEGGDFSMCLLLPRSGVGLSKIEDKVSIQTLQAWLSVEKDYVHVSLPRFRFETTFDMSDELKNLGISRAFSASQADFSKMASDPEGLYIGSVIHKAFIDVNEEGAEAAAATAIVTRGGSVMPAREPKEFRADRPFLFLIRDRRSKLIYFVGKVVNPK